MGSSARRRRVAGITVAVALLGLTAACGTRLPDADFAAGAVTAGAAVAGTDTGPLPAAAAGSGQPSPGPGVAAADAGTGGATGTTGTAGGTGTTTVGGTTAATGGGTTATTTGTTKGAASSGSTTGRATGTSPGSGTAAAANTASDRGVTPTTISVCNVVTKGGPFGPTQFTPGYYGAAAFFADLNSRGGINGRAVNFRSETDDGSTSGDNGSIHTCIDTDKAFAFVANNIFQYGGVGYEDSQDVPDIGGQPISTAYYYYPHLYAIGGVHVPRNHQLGYSGTMYDTSEQGEFFKQRIGVKKIGIVYYDQASSQYGAEEIGDGFKAAGLSVTTYSVNLGLPNFSSVVSQMQSDGVDSVADALDQNGNQKLCQAVEQNTSFLKQMKAKISTIASWTQNFGSQFASTPGCLAKSFSEGSSWNYADTTNASVAAFDTAIKKYFPSQANAETQWMLEGYAAADWFTAAAKSCGANLTRTCVESFMNRNATYDADGLLSPLTSFQIRTPAYYSQPTNQCSSDVQWSTAAGTWVNRGTLSKDCFASPGYSYPLVQPS